MKKRTLNAMLTMASLSFSLLTSAQVETKAPTTLNILPAADPASIRVQNGLIAHRVGGTIGSFTAADQWIGIGRPGPNPPLNGLYGVRTQWAGQTLITALRQQAAPSTIKDALMEWGNQGGEMQFRYITNPLVSTGFIKIHSLTSAGNAYYGATPPPAFFGTPKVGINTANQPGFNSTITNTISTVNSLFRTTPSTANTFGVGAYSFINSTTNNIANYGLLSFTNGTGAGSSNFGVYSIIGAPAANNNYALFGSAPVGPNSWAGFFQGNTFCTGLYIGSDAEIKADVQAEPNAMSTIMKVKPVIYKYRQDNITKGLNLPEEIQHGFIAQDLAVVLPEAVRSSRYSIAGGNGDSPTEAGSSNFLSVNYISLISILYKGVQEQQAQIEELRRAVGLGARTTGATASPAGATLAPEDQGRVALTAGTFQRTDFTLAQNTPNPFSAQTTIRFALPNGVRNATIAVFDLNGRMQQQYTGLNGSSQVIIEGNSLQAGMYIYSLLVEGQEVLSKRMILTR